VKEVKEVAKDGFKAMVEMVEISKGAGNGKARAPIVVQSAVEVVQKQDGTIPATGAEFFLKNSYGQEFVGLVLQVQNKLKAGTTANTPGTCTKKDLENIALGLLPVGERMLNVAKKILVRCCVC